MRVRPAVTNMRADDDVTLLVAIIFGTAAAGGMPRPSGDYATAGAHIYLMQPLVTARAMPHDSQIFYSKIIFDTPGASFDYDFYSLMLTPILRRQFLARAAADAATASARRA